MVLPILGATAGAAARGAGAAAGATAHGAGATAGAAARGAGSAAKGTASTTTTAQGEQAATQGRSNKFLLSAKRRAALNAYRQFHRRDENEPARTRGRRAGFTDEQRAGQGAAYTTSAGDVDATSNLGQLRLLAQEAGSAVTSGSKLSAIKQGARTGFRLRQGLGRGSFNDGLLIGLAFLKDCMDFVLELATLGVTLGLLAASFGLFITVIIIVVRMFRGGAISRFVMRWFLVFLIDITIGQYLLFIPTATIGMILLVRQERRKALRTQTA